MDARGVNSTADLMEAIFSTPEPGRTRLRQAWLRLRQEDREMNSLEAGVSQDRAVMVGKHLKHQAAAEALRKHGTIGQAARSLGVDRTTIYRWLGGAGAGNEVARAVSALSAQYGDV